jgi:hypothetical protein
VNRPNLGPESDGGDLYFGRFIYIAAQLRNRIEAPARRFPRKTEVFAARPRRATAKKGHFMPYDNP